MGGDAVSLFADAWRFVGPVRPQARGAAVELWPRAGLCVDGAGAIPDLAFRRQGDLRHHLGEHLDVVCLHRRHHASGTARRGVRQGRRGVRGRFYPRARAWRIAGRHGSAAAVLGRGGLEFCQYALRPADPPRVAAAGSARSVALEKCKSLGCAASVALRFCTRGTIGGEFLCSGRACGSALNLRALRDLPLRLGCGDRRPDAGDGRYLRDGRAGRRRRADGPASRRAPRAAAGTWLRRPRLSDFRRGAKRSAVLARHSRDGAVGRRRRGGAGADDAIGRARPAGPVAGRDHQRAKRIPARGTVSVYADICLFHQPSGAAEIAGGAVPAGVGVTGAGDSDRGAHAGGGAGSLRADCFRTSSRCISSAPRVFPSADAVAGLEPISFDWPVMICIIAARTVFRPFAAHTVSCKGVRKSRTRAWIPNMFVSFFPRPKLFFLSAIVWTALAMAFWYGFSGDLIGSSAPEGVGVVLFWSARSLWFDLYFALGVAVFAAAWMLFAPHPWAPWSILGSALILFTSYFQVQVSVAINSWYRPFYDLVQAALSKSAPVTVERFYSELATFAGIAFVAVVVGVMTRFFVSHYIFRWRTAMNDFYMVNWPRLRAIEGASQRVQEDTMRFATTVEGLCGNLISAVLTLLAFLPVLVRLSSNVTELPLIGSIPYPVVFAAVIWSVLGTGALALIGIRLPVSELFGAIRRNYFRLYLNFMYFNIGRIVYLQTDVIFPYILLGPTIIAGKITLGSMNQILNAFTQVRTSFQYLVNSWSTIVELISIYQRLRGFEAKIGGEPLPSIETRTEPKSL